MKKTAFLFITALALTNFAFGEKKEPAKPVPSASVDQVSWTPVVNDEPFDKGTLAGKVVVVEQWGVNCGPCIASLPEMAKLAKRYEKKGLVVVGQECQGGTKDQILKLLKDARVKYPVMSGGSVPVNSDGIPHALVFGADGKLVWHGHPADKEFEDSVKDALKAVVEKK